MPQLAVEGGGVGEEVFRVDADDVGEAIDLHIAGLVEAAQPFRDGRLGYAQLAGNGSLGFQVLFQMVERGFQVFG